jgi:hypothetical protein
MSARRIYSSIHVHYCCIMGNKMPPLHRLLAHQKLHLLLVPFGLSSNSITLRIFSIGFLNIFAYGKHVSRLYNKQCLLVGIIFSTIKIKLSHHKSMEALGGRGGIAPTHSRPRHYMWVSGQRHAQAALCPRRKDPRYPLYRRLGGPQSRSGHRGYRKNLSPLQGVEPRSAGRPVRSQTLIYIYIYIYIIFHHEFRP